MFSALHLADGWLTARDAYDLRLRCSLVTLSACETGINAVTPGDELLGLVRGFLAAGAPALLVSLWPVDDATTVQFMSHFYTAWLAGATSGCRTPGGTVRAARAVAAPVLLVAICALRALVLSAPDTLQHEATGEALSMNTKPHNDVLLPVRADARRRHAGDCGPVRADGGRGYMPGEIVVKLYNATDLGGVAADFGVGPDTAEAVWQPADLCTAHCGRSKMRPIRQKQWPRTAASSMSNRTIATVRPRARSDHRGRASRTSPTMPSSGPPTRSTCPRRTPPARGAGVIVAVLDTGVDATHPALAGHLMSGYDFVDMDADPSEVGVARE